MINFNPFSNKAKKTKKERKKEKLILLRNFGVSDCRYKIVLAAITLAFVALIAKAIDVQIISANKYQMEADKYYVKDKVVPFVRGSIVDRNHNLLSVSVPMNTIIADPKVVLEYEDKIDRERWDSLANILNIPSEELWQKIKRNPKSRYLVLAKDFTLENGEYIRQLRVKGITTENISKRFYPRVEETAHLVGYVDSNNVGIEGLEKSFNAYLVGQNGKEIARRDSRGNLIERVAEIKSQDAREIVLSIDEKLQSVVYREIKKAVAQNQADSGTAVLVDVRTGEILAMANAPSYNPNNREGLELDVLRNRAVTDTFEPASTVKPFVVLTALQRGVVRSNEIINTKPFFINGKEIRDVSLHEQLSLTGILQKSSNVGVSRLALKMPPTALIDTYRSIGFGKSTELGLGGEQSGILSTDRKRDIERAALSYGYGLSVTPLQLARAYATLGSFGVYRPLSITKVDPPVIGDRVFSEKVTKEVVAMMEAVTHEGGGGVAAAVEGYRVAVKTGTAKMLENGQYVDKYRAYTAGIAPVSNPRYALVVLINNPTAGKYYGGAISAPVFSAIMGSALRSNNIAPDNLQSGKTVERMIYLKRSSNMNTPHVNKN